jgi:hypothetical protein
MRTTQEHVQYLAVEGPLPGPCPDGYYHFEHDGVPVYLDGTSNQLYAETGEALMRFEGELRAAWKLAEAIMQVSGRSDEREKLKIHFKKKQEDFLTLLGAAEAA